MSDPLSSPASDTPLAPAYTAALRTHALTLLALGHARMTPANFTTSEEDAITGELTREMNAVIEDESAPEWAEHYSAREQVRANTPGLLGKARPIVDIEFERHRRGRRPRLRFEAKRLGPGRKHSANSYFGDGGLEAFTTGYYDRTHADVGMLGYVQSDDESKWAEKLSTASMSRLQSLGIIEAWSAFPGEGFAPFTYRTGHHDESGRTLNVFHVLLAFLSTGLPCPAVE